MTEKMACTAVVYNNNNLRRFFEAAKIMYQVISYGKPGVKIQPVVSFYL